MIKRELVFCAFLAAGCFVAGLSIVGWAILRTLGVMP
jgi:hypothetical protein